MEAPSLSAQMKQTKAGN